MKKKYRCRKKGQSAIEFIVLTAFAMVFFVVFMSVMQSNISKLQIERDNTRMAQVMNILDSEIRYAESSMPIYTRDFELPSLIDGFPVNVSCQNSRDVVFKYKGSDYVYFLRDDVSDCDALGPGSNTIIRHCPSQLTICPVDFI